MKRIRLFILVLFLLGCGSGGSNGAGGPVDKDCSDFSSQQEAQAYFDSLGGSPSNNADRLDVDHDGIACEALPSLPVVTPGVQSSGLVIDVVDGDTIKVQGITGIVTVRLAEIDSPEKNQDFGADATQFTTFLALGKVVDFFVTDKDKFGRSIAHVILPDGRDLSKELLSAGFAWWFEAFSSDFSLRDLERKARKNKIGLWQDANPIPPWDFRN